jgi:hypothetical protein
LTPPGQKGDGHFSKSTGEDIGTIGTIEIRGLGAEVKAVRRKSSRQKRNPNPIHHPIHLLWAPLFLAALFMVGCPGGGDGPPRFKDCSQDNTCEAGTICFHGLCQPLKVCSTDADCDDGEPGQCTDCGDFESCEAAHPEGGCNPPKKCVPIGESGLSACDQTSAGCEEADNNYYCGAASRLTCKAAQTEGAQAIFYCGP